MIAPATKTTQGKDALIALIAVAAVVIAVIAFRDSLLELVNRWNRQDEYSHGYFIPVISAWLMWTRRDALRASVGQPSWWGPVLILVASAMHVIGELSALFVASQVAFVLVLMGVTLAIGGFPLARVAFIPIVFLLFAIPLPYFVDTVLSWRLQLISSELGVAVIRLFGISVFLEGNVIDLGTYKLQVVEACSGLRYLYPFLSLGFLAAYLFNAPLWQRALIFVSTVPITIVMNSFRIGMIGVFVEHWGIEMAEGALHLFEGWIIFMACAVILLAEILLLARFGQKKRFFDVFFPPKVQAVDIGAARARTRTLVPASIGLALMLLTGAAALTLSTREEILPERAQFATFPTQLGDWRGRTSSLERQVEHFLGLTDYILTDYQSPSGRPVNLYVAYYASQRKGVSPHSPSVCIPGNGWQIANFERTRREIDGQRESLPFNRVLIEKEGRKQIVYYWFEQRGRKIENEWWSKFYLLADAVRRNRTDGALVRLTTPVFPQETEADADKRLAAFMKDLLPSLVGYLPAGLSDPVTASKQAPSQS